MRCARAESRPREAGSFVPPESLDPAHRRGLSGVAEIVGPLVGTSLLARFGNVASRAYVPGAAFFASAALSALGLVFALRLFARQAKLPLA